MLESGEFVTIAELADRKQIARTYVTRVLRLMDQSRGLISSRAAVFPSGEILPLARVM